MPGFTVTFPEVAASSSGVDAAARELGAELRRLSVEIAQLLGSGWRGRAATAFAAEWEVWHAAALDVVAALATLGGLLGEGGSAYVVTETAVARAAS